MTGSLYPSGPYGYGSMPYVGSVSAYPVPGPVGTGPLFNGQYATNLVNDPTLDYMMDLTNATQSSYYGSYGNSYGSGGYMPSVSNNSNVQWYNTAIAPVLQEADAMTKSVLGGTPISTQIPTGNPYANPANANPYGNPYAQQDPYAQQQALPEALQDHKGKSSGNSLAADITGGAGLGGFIGAIAGGGVLSWATVGIGAAIGAVAGGLKHFILG